MPEHRQADARGDHGEHQPRQPSEEHDQHERPQEVELLLLRERPEVPKLAGHRACRRLGRHRQVGEVAEPGDDAEDVLSLRSVADQRRGRRDDQERAEQGDECGQETQCASLVERSQGDRATRGVLLEEQRRDEEPAEHEEEVDAEVPAGQRPCCVVEQHGGDRHGAQSVERGSVPQLRGLGRHVSPRRGTWALPTDRVVPPASPPPTLGL